MHKQNISKNEIQMVVNFVLSLRMTTDLHIIQILFEEGM